MVGASPPPITLSFGKEPAKFASGGEETRGVSKRVPTALLALDGRRVLSAFVHTRLSLLPICVGDHNGLHADGDPLITKRLCSRLQKADSPVKEREAGTEAPSMSFSLAHIM